MRMTKLAITAQVFTVLMALVSLNSARAATPAETHKMDRKVTLACERSLRHSGSVAASADDVGKIHSCIKNYRIKVHACAKSGGLKTNISMTASETQAYRTCQGQAFGAI